MYDPSKQVLDSWFYVIHAVALFTIACSLFSSITIIIASLRSSARRQRLKTDVAARLPFVLSCLDCLFALAHLTDHVYVLVAQRAVHHGVCQGLAVIVISTLGAQIFLTFLISVHVYLGICRQLRIDLGKYDWKLLVVVFSSPILYAILCLIFDGAGEAEYWCVFAHTTFAGQMCELVFSMLLGVMIAASVFMYFRVVLRLEQHRVQTLQTLSAMPTSKTSKTGTLTLPPSINHGATSQSTAATEKGDSEAAVSVRISAPCEITPTPSKINTAGAPSNAPTAMVRNQHGETIDGVLARAGRRVMGYLAIFVLQWTMMVPYSISVDTMDATHPSIFLCVVIFVNSGGALNAVMFFFLNRQGSMRRGSEMSTGLSAASRSEPHAPPPKVSQHRSSVVTQPSSKMDAVDRIAVRHS